MPSFPLRGQRVSAWLFLLAAVTAIPANAQAAEELRWRRVPVIKAMDQFMSPTVDDVANAPDGSVYMVYQRSIFLLEDGEIKPRFGSLNSFGIDKSGAPKNKYTVRVRKSTSTQPDHSAWAYRDTRPPYQINGIASRFAITPTGEFWVACLDGFIYRPQGENWEAEPGVRGDQIEVAPDGATAVTWSNDAHFQSHKDWLEKHPEPYVRINGKWRAAPELIGIVAAAFDQNSTPLALVFDQQTREHRLMRYESGAWAVMPAPAEIRSIQSDANGDVLALTYRSERIKGRGWVRSEQWFYRLTDGAWARVEELPRLNTAVRLDSRHHGELISYQGNPTWVAQERWLSPKLVTIEEEAVADEPPPTPELQASGSTWYGRIDVIDPNIQIDPAAKALWADGAYLYLREDGALGMNWETPDQYFFDPANGWLQDEGSLVLRFGVFMYAFELEPPFAGGMTTLGTAFKMEIARQETAP
ncbi:MAG: hypothetical protein H6978_04750 [Gammaproteobacteria bacterium]|nr:hypothetical protein [Gammaproteobacteria bacterium]